MNKIKAICLGIMAVWLLPLFLLSTPFIGAYGYLSAAIPDIRDQWTGKRDILGG